MLRLAWRIWYKNMPANPEHATTALERLVALAERDAVSEPAVASVASLLASRACRVHIIGIGGTGMSAIAALLLDLGHIVTGSDQAQSSAVDALVERGATVTIGHGGALGAATDIVARSTAITDSNPEVQSAAAASIPVVRRAEILAALSRLAPSLAVSGTHGKTTTSAMLATALVHAGVPTSYLIGSTVSALGGAASWHPNASYFVIEADESDRTHLALSRFGGIVTNIEPEHLDRYGSAGAVIDGFIEFVRGCEGPVLLCADDPGCRLVSNFLRRSTDGARTIHTYGSTPGADYVIAEVDLHPSSSSFVLVAGDHSYPVRLNVTGGHNVANAAAVMLRRPLRRSSASAARHDDLNTEARRRAFDSSMTTRIIRPRSKPRWPRQRRVVRGWWRFSSRICIRARPITLPDSVRRSPRPMSLLWRMYTEPAKNRFRASLAR